MSATRSEKDIFVEAGIEMPSHLNTYSKRWASMLLVAITGAFSAGPFASWPTLEPLLIDQGVWAGPDQKANLSSVFSIATGVSLVGMFFAGVMYDAIGPRLTGVIGAWGAALSLLLLAVGVQVPSLNWLLWIAYPAANVFGYMNHYDVFAWLWLLPDDQSTVAALTGAIQCLSDSFCLLAVLLHHLLGVQMSTYFLFTAVFSTVAGFIALAYVPGRKETSEYAAAIMSYQAAQAAAKATSQGYGATDDFFDDDTPFQRQISEDVSSSWVAIEESGKALKNTCILFAKVHPTIMSLMAFYFMATYMFNVYPLFEMYPFYTDLVGKAKAVELVDIFGGLYAVIGAACILAFGVIVDRIGLHKAIVYVSVLTLANGICYAIPRVDVQVAGQVLLAFTSNTWYVTLPRVAIAYGPPELFGTISGVFCIFLGFGQIILTRVGAWACEAIVLVVHPIHPPPVLFFLATIELWCFLGLSSMAFVSIYWLYYPVPRAGETTMAHVRFAEEQPFFGKNAMSSDDKEIAFPIGPPAAKKLMGLKKDTTATCCGCIPKLGKPSEV